MEYNVAVDEFQGPMDLLLDLIKKNNLDIWNINLSLITDQYLQYLKKMEEINLNVSGEYLVIAAELIGFKSRKLLPNQEEESVEEQEFIRKVIDYKQYKEITEQFKELSIKRSEFFSKKASDINIYKEEHQITEQISEDELLDALYQFLKRKEDEKPLQTRVTKKEYSIQKRSEEIIEILNGKNKISFFELFETYHKPHIIITFLAILEMSRQLIIELTQEQNNIYLIKKEGES